MQLVCCCCIGWLALHLAGDDPAAGVLSEGPGMVRVELLSEELARRVLTAGPCGADGSAGPGLVLPEPGLVELIQLTGRWPLLLRLANRYLVDVISSGASPADAVGRLVGRLRAGGSAMLDVADEDSRDRAAAASIGASLALLSEAERCRFAELAVFAADVWVPCEVLRRL
ncbi:hypothetical protein [Myceligenerans indicum]|uniref:Uncharacterized protein n=1 Tax=Myceligenerans indicum TaxID=2593663 RepID=A0ABS1LQM1_9MICO|nr:hypothetical protein [Myceligenerans indicum]MBL0888495.1 hypothetical protein [Myceligenerans indicum]